MDIITTSQFNQVLLQKLCETNETNKTNENLCLISKMPLENNHIKLQCEHAFNYSPLLWEICEQKNSNYSKTLEIQKLEDEQIKCPYCRTIQNGILPWRSPHDKIWNVNWPPAKQYYPNNCKYIFISGKKCNQNCNKKCLNKYCLTHEKIMWKRKQRQDEKNAKKLAQKNITQLINNIITKKSTVKNRCTYIYRKGQNKGYKCTCSKIYNKDKQLCITHHKYHIKHKKKCKKSTFIKTNLIPIKTPPKYISDNNVFIPTFDSPIIHDLKISKKAVLSPIYETNNTHQFKYTY